MKAEILERLSRETEQLKTQGLFKPERVLASPQQARRCASATARSPQPVRQQLPRASPTTRRVREAAHRAHRPLRLRHGVGALHLRHADVHKELEARLSRVPRHRRHDPLFVVLRRQRRAVRDAARRAGRGHQRRAQPREHHRRHPALQGAAAALREQRPGRARGAAEGGAADARCKLIATDGVFSMDGMHRATCRTICDLADRYGALVMVDDSHAVGFMGASGRGTHEHCGVMGRIDILTGTLGKALGGASAAATRRRARRSSRWLRQRSRPYLFSNSAPPVDRRGDAARARPARARATSCARRLRDNARVLPRADDGAGLQARAGRAPDHPGDARRRAARRASMADRLLERGRLRHRLLVPGRAAGQGAHPHADVARRTRREQLDRAVAAFAKVGKSAGRRR